MIRNFYFHYKRDTNQWKLVALSNLDGEITEQIYIVDFIECNVATKTAISFSSPFAVVKGRGNIHFELEPPPYGKSTAIITNI